jgi:hypothetical protein
MLVLVLVPVRILMSKSGFEDEVLIKLIVGDVKLMSPLMSLDLLTIVVIVMVMVMMC